jgi:hypothetical protein
MQIRSEKPEMTSEENMPESADKSMYISDGRRAWSLILRNPLHAKNYARNRDDDANIVR